MSNKTAKQPGASNCVSNGLLCLNQAIKTSDMISDTALNEPLFLANVWEYLGIKDVKGALMKMTCVNICDVSTCEMLVKWHGVKSIQRNCQSLFLIRNNLLLSRKPVYFVSIHVYERKQNPLSINNRRKYATFKKMFSREKRCRSVNLLC